MAIVDSVNMNLKKMAVGAVEMIIVLVVMHSIERTVTAVYVVDSD